MVNSEKEYFIPAFIEEVMQCCKSKLEYITIKVVECSGNFIQETGEKVMVIANEKNIEEKKKEGGKKKCKL